MAQRFPCPIPGKALKRYQVDLQRGQRLPRDASITEFRSPVGRRRGNKAYTANQFPLADNFLKKCKVFAAKNNDNVQKLREDNANDWHASGDDVIAGEIREALSKYYAENQGVKAFVRLQKTEEMQKLQMDQKHTNDTNDNNGVDTKLAKKEQDKNVSTFTN